MEEDLLAECCLILSEEVQENLRINAEEHEAALETRGTLLRPFVKVY